MTRAAAIAAAEAYFDEGGFVADLARRVAIPTESQVEERAAGAARLSRRRDRAVAGAARLHRRDRRQSGARRPDPDRRAQRGEALPTVFGYGHGDVIRGLEPQWREGLSPWQLQPVGDRFTAAAPPTTRASTRSTWRRSDAC